MNTKSSTETDIVATDDMMMQLLWEKYSLEVKGYRVGMYKMYHNNMIAMLL